MSGGSNSRRDKGVGGWREGERNKVRQKKRAVRSNSTMSWLLLLVGAVGLVAELGACPCCLSPLALSFPLLLGGLWAGGGAPAPSRLSSCRVLPLKPALQRAATQMLPVELLNLESS